MQHHQLSGSETSLFHINWELTFILFLLVCLYFTFIGPLRMRFSQSSQVPVWKMALFLSGVLLYWGAMGSPLAEYAHQSFTGHMAQMTVLYLVMPPILLLGLPGWMLQPLFRKKGVHAFFSFATKPLIAIFAFNGALSIYHVPAVFDHIMQNQIFMLLSHMILQWLAFCMWWVIACPVSALDRVKPLHKLAYVFGNGVLLTPACALIIFADEPLFQTFAGATIDNLTPLQDQALGGIIMKITQEAIFIVMLAYVFFQWVRQERIKDEQERLKMQN